VWISKTFEATIDHPYLCTQVDDDPEEAPPMSKALREMQATSSISYKGRDMTSGRYEGPPTRYSSHRLKWKSRLLALIASITASTLWTFATADEEMTVIEAAAAKAGWPLWLDLCLFSQKGLLAYLEKAILPMCENLFTNGIEHSGPGKPRWVVWIGLSQWSGDELPAVWLSDVCWPFKVEFSSSVFWTLAAFYEVLCTPLGQLLCLAYSLREKWNSEMPPGLVDGHYSEDFFFYAPDPCDVFEFLRRFYQWEWCYWPSLMLGFPFAAAMYDSKTGLLIAGAEQCINQIVAARRLC
jgi:hypothetical protein